MAAEFSPLVVDETYARSTSFGGQVVPGSMISALAIGLGSLDVPIPATAGMVGMSWRFLQPVRPGDSLHTTWRLNRKRAVENPAVGLVFWQIEVFNQRAEVVAAGEVGRLVQRARPSASDSARGVAVAAAASASGAEAAEPSGTRRRRRRGGRGSGGGAGEARPAAPAGSVAGTEPPPEPAPADTPSPSRRRRRRRNGNGGVGGREGGPSEAESAPPPHPTEVAAPAAATEPAERGLRSVFRRLRGGGSET